jgi:lipoprotein-anchoring transpeptidase ErfK/SrfK
MITKTSKLASVIVILPPNIWSKQNLTMSRFSTSLLFTTGLLLTTLLTTVPTRLDAQTNPPGSPSTQKSPTPKLDSNLPSTGSSPTPGQNPSATPTTKPPVSATSQPPVENVVNLVLKLKERRVYIYKGDKLLKKYPVAIGKKGRETPTGEWQVMEKIRNPGWTSFKNGEVFSPGRENPLGSRWIGCVRMYNRDVKALFPLVKVGTTVKVVNE